MRGCLTCVSEQVAVDQLAPRFLRPFRTGIPEIRVLLLFIYMATAGGFPEIPVRNGFKEHGIDRLFSVEFMGHRYRQNSREPTVQTPIIGVCSVDLFMSQSRLIYSPAASSATGTYTKYAKCAALYCFIR